MNCQLKILIFLLLCRVQGPLLFNYICQFDTYSEAVVLLYMRQLVNALLWLHKRNIAHLDIKPENIMVNTIGDPPDVTASAPIKHKGLLKLIDFGESVGAINRNIVLPPSNLEFSAPEMVIGHTLSHYTDSWCFGIMLYVFLSGVSPFLDDSIEETTTNILKCDFSTDISHFRDISNDAKNLLKRLLILQGSARATMTDCQMSTWFTQVISLNRPAYQTTARIYLFPFSFINLLNAGTIDIAHIKGEIGIVYPEENA